MPDRTGRLARLTPTQRRLFDLWRSRQPGTRVQAQPVVAVVASPGTSPDPAALRRFLLDCLPAAMVPARIVPVQQIPRTAAGKPDRAALAKVLADPAPPDARRAVPPRDGAERRMSEAFARVLGAAPGSVLDDFFADLGGHSLLATQLVSAIRREWGVPVPLRLVFEHPTVAALAQAVEELGRTAPADSRIPRRDAAG